MVKFKVQAINDDILAKLRLKNRYKFLIDNLIPVLSDDQWSFLEKVEDFCLKFEMENSITHGPDESIYDWIPAFGEQGYV